MMQCRSELVKSVVFWKVESSKQIHSLVCCSMTVDSKSRTQYLVAPAVSIDYPTIQEDAHRRRIQEEQQAFDLLVSEEERDTAQTTVPRLHGELGYSDPREMIDYLRRKHAHRLIIAAAKKLSFIACEESPRRRRYPTVARAFHEEQSWWMLEVVPPQ